MTRSDSISVLLLALLPGCPHFQPDLALRPTPYTAASSFALADVVAYRPDLDDHRLAVGGGGDPGELAAAPLLVTQCMTERAMHAQPIAILPPAVAHADAFSVRLSVTLVRPGWTVLHRDTATASATAPGATAQASAPVVSAGEGEEALAAALLEVRATDGTPIDRVRIFAQRFPREDEPLEQRAAALCEILLDETERYLAWRVGGNG